MAEFNPTPKVKEKKVPVTIEISESVKHAFEVWASDLEGYSSEELMADGLAWIIQSKSSKNKKPRGGSRPGSGRKKEPAK